MPTNETYRIGKKILHYIDLAGKKPFLPVWGEIFNILYSIKRESDDNLKDKIVYNVQGEYLMIYQVNKNRFVLTVHGVTFNLKICELTTALLEGRFLPSNSTS